MLDQLRGAVVAARDRVGHEYVPPEQVELISAHVAALRRLDDRHGGGALSLRYVTAELRSVIDLVEYASYGRQAGQRLLTIVADLAQLLGWLSFDSSRYGAAERYLLLSLGVCRALGAGDRAANAIGMLSYVSAFAGHGPQAVRLAEAAARECGRGDPVLRARLLGREATAAAADGDLARFRRQSQAAAVLLPRHATSDAPSFLYYLTPEQLAAEAGQALVVLAERTTANRRRLLSEAAETLGGAVTAMASSRPVGLPAVGALARHLPGPGLPAARRPGRSRGGHADRAGPAGRRCSRRGPAVTCAACGRLWAGGRVPLSCASSSTSSMRHHRLCDDQFPTRPLPPARIRPRSPNARPATRTRPGCCGRSTVSSCTGTGSPTRPS